jgi:hypothetical protein
MGSAPGPVHLRLADRPRDAVALTVA